jgi:hypothetical protein
MKYSVEVEEKITYFKTRMAEVKKTDVDVKLVKELFPEVSIWVDSEVNVNFEARSMTEVKDMLKIFARNKVLIEEFVESQSCPIWFLKGRKVRIRLAPTWTTDADGATCRLVKVGENTYSTPIYKLVCDGKEA